MTTKLVLLWTIAGVLSGCKLAVPPSRPEVLSGALPPTTSIPPSWSSSSQGGDVANEWLFSFHDAGLDAIVAEAIANNLDLRQAAARVAIAREAR